MTLRAASPALMLVLLVAALAPGQGLSAQRSFDSVVVTTRPVAGAVSMLVGAGGNIAVLVGPDGVLMVDDQFAPLTPKIKAAVAALSPGPVRFVVNTHWHGDHVGGNENFGREGALIVAHDNVRKRMSVTVFSKLFNDTVRASPSIALPVVTFTQSVSFHLNGEDVDVIHMPPAHTDGDAALFFRQANVFHTGDIYFNGLYPVIDVESGGGIEGMVRAADLILDLVRDETKIIPGHGPLATKADLRVYRDMLAAIRDRVRSMVQAGKSLQEVVAAKPSAEWDERWGKTYLTPAQFLATVYASFRK